jgi:CDP-glucose 4,6-dehydratase
MTSPSTLRDLPKSFEGRRVLLTGHTGFKGGWMALWLRRFGAQVVGVSLPPEDERGFFNATRLEQVIDHRIADIRQPAAFADAIRDTDADLVVHMAAQALVRRSYEEPLDTYLTNVIGTAAVLDAARRMRSLKGALVVTSDKCYENREWVWGYRESDPMGGADPYSSSKGCAELLVSAYRRSFFSATDGPQLASSRAGNVIGGGDWSKDRLIPDIVKSAIAGTPVVIRNPGSIRPWQHVLEPVHGYLLLCARLLDRDRAFADGWNFGPDAESVADVETVAVSFRRAWGPEALKIDIGRSEAAPHEATVLRLDSTKARTQLGWKPRLSLEEAVKLTADWHMAALGGADMRQVSESQIAAYELKVSAGRID